MASMTPFQAMNLEDSAPQTTASPQPSTPQPSQAAAPKALAGASDHVLNLSADADSWFEVTDAGGKTLDSGVLHAGDTRSYHSAAPLDITIGDADAVDVQSDGKSLSLAPYRHARVARFKVFASGDNNG